MVVTAGRVRGRWVPLGPVAPLAGSGAPRGGCAPPAPAPLCPRCAGLRHRAPRLRRFGGLWGRGVRPCSGCVSGKEPLSTENCCSWCALRMGRGSSASELRNWRGENSSFGFVSVCLRCLCTHTMRMNVWSLPTISYGQLVYKKAKSVPCQKGLIKTSARSLNSSSSHCH